MISRLDAPKCEAPVYCPFCHNPLNMDSSDLEYGSVDCSHCPAYFGFEDNVMDEIVIYISKSQDDNWDWSFYLNTLRETTCLRKHVTHKPPGGIAQTFPTEIITLNYLIPVTPSNSREWLARILNLKAFL
jgi:hypothetical protein